MIYGITLLVLILFGILYSHRNKIIAFFHRTPLKLPSTIKLDQLESSITILLKDKSKFNYFGIIGNGQLHFIKNEKKLEIVYFFTEKNRSKNLEKLTNFTSHKELSFSPFESNTKDVDTLKKAPVYFIEVKKNAETAFNIAKEILIIVFDDDDTVFETIL